jgi:hypothetical protein
MFDLWNLFGLFDAIFWFVAAIAVILAFRYFLTGNLRPRFNVPGSAGAIRNGLPSVATVETISETGVTVSSPWSGPDAAVFRLTLLVAPIGGGQPYEVAVDQTVPRVVRPMIVPGGRVGVLIDPMNPANVTLDLANIGGPVGMAGLTPPPAPEIPGQVLGSSGTGLTMSFDANGQPTGDLNSVVSGVKGGTMNTINSSADQLLASGTRGIATITTAQPLGKTVRDMNPKAKAERLDYPMWLFTVEVSLTGQPPFPAIFGHYVPTHRIALVAPGVRLAVAVNEADRNEDVAIDWERSPLPPGM